ncbi:MAG: GCN5-related N-acetyltransferase [Frankiales bacterium]|nr:GCN5-related N-acetyltransferase [Frankiales bacterium]
MPVPRRLTADDLRALDDLERRVVAADGGRLELERTVLRAEHALVLDVAPQGPEDPRTTLRPAVPGDAPAVARLVEAGLGHASDGAGPGTWVAEQGGVVVGTLRVRAEDGTASVHGFAVDPVRRGEGIGRDVLRRVCRQALAAGARRVALEVAVDDPAALHLHTSTGFVLVAGEEYWRLPLWLSPPTGAGRRRPGTRRRRTVRSRPARPRPPRGASCR